jgi:hypothetical protein
MSRSKKHAYSTVFCTALLLVPGLASSARAEVCRECGRSFGNGCQCASPFWGVPSAIAGLFCHDICKKCGHRLTDCTCFPEAMPWGYYPTCWRPWPGEWQGCPYCPPACPPGQGQMFEPAPAQPSAAIIPGPPLEAVPQPRSSDAPAPPTPSAVQEAKPPAETTEPAATPAPGPQTSPVDSPADRTPATPEPAMSSSESQARRGKSRLPAFWRSELKPLTDSVSTRVAATWSKPVERDAVLCPESERLAPEGDMPAMMNSILVRPLPPIDATAVRNPDLIRRSGPSVPAVPIGENAKTSKAPGDRKVNRLALRDAVSAEPIGSDARTSERGSDRQVSPPAAKADASASTGFMANPLRLRSPDARPSGGPSTSRSTNPLR